MTNNPRAFYEQRVMYEMETGNAAAVQAALDAELALKHSGAWFSQKLIDCCTAWVSEHTFETLNV